MSFAVSNVTATTLQKLAVWIGRNLTPGLIFRKPTAVSTSRPEYQWPTHQGKEDELKGYDSAVEWWRTHVLPGVEGVSLVMKHEADFMECRPGHKVHIKGGGTDGLFVLSEYAHAVEAATDIKDWMLAIVSQLKLKSRAAVAAPQGYNKFKSQTGTEQVCSRYIQGAVIAVAAEDAGVKEEEVPDSKFMSVLTDNHNVWAQFKYVGQDNFAVYERAPSGFPLADAAIEQIKQSLKDAAKRLRLINDVLSGTPEGAPHPTGAAGPAASCSGDGGGGAPPARGGAGGAPGGGKTPQDCVTRSKRAPGSGIQQHTANQISMHQLQATESSVAKHVDLVKVTQAALQRIRNDEDLNKQFAAGYHALMTDHLRSAMGYEGLLCLDKAPRTIQLPDAQTLLDLPVSEQPRLLCEAMQGALQLTSAQDKTMTTPVHERCQISSM